MGNLKLILLTTIFTLFAFTSHADTIGNEVNLLKNPLFEAKTTAWTKTGASTFTIDAATPLEGLYSGLWDASATGEFLRSTAITVPAGLQGRTCLIEFLYLWDTGTAGHILMEASDGTNIVASLALDPTSGGVAKKGQLNFTCPSSGTLRFQLESTANATAIKLDRAFLGAGRNVVQLSQTELFAGITYANSTNCFNTTASNTIAEVADNANCTSRTALGTGQFVNNRFKLRVPSLPKGRYELQAMIPVYADTAGTSCEVYMLPTAGSMPGGYLSISEGTSSSNGRGSLIGIPWDQLTDVGQTDFYFNWRRTGGTGTCYFATGAAGGTSFSMTLKKYPLASAEALNLETSGWRVDANIVGSNPVLSAGNVSTYTGVENGNLSLSNNAGMNVIPAQIPCSSTNAPSGSTCAAGNESVGVVFTLPNAGDVRACVSYSHFMQDNDGAANIGIDDAWQIIETSGDSQTIAQEGKTRFQSGLSTNSATGPERIWTTVPIHLCGTFSFTSSGKKTLRLAYEQTVSGTIASNLLLADGNTSTGQRDIHWEVTPLNQQLPAPVFTAINQKVSSNASNERVERVSVSSTCSTSPCTIAGQSGTWVTNITRSAPGTYQINIPAGIFSGPPICTGSTLTNLNLSYFYTTATTTQVFLATSNSSTAALIDSNFNVICMGPK